MSTTGAASSRAQLRPVEVNLLGVVNSRSSAARRTRSTATGGPTCRRGWRHRSRAQARRVRVRPGRGPRRAGRLPRAPRPGSAARALRLLMHREPGRCPDRPGRGRAGSRARPARRGGRVIAAFAQEDLARMRPADQVTVRACGQGWRPPGFPPEVAVLNLDPAVLAALPVATRDGGPVRAGVRIIVPSKVSGNGIGRPSVSWDLDLQIRAGLGVADLLLGDLVAAPAGAGAHVGRGQDERHGCPGRRRHPVP